MPGAFQSDDGDSAVGRRIMESLYTRELQLGYSHVFQDGRLPPAALMEELEETASEHCRIIGQDIFSLLGNRTAWILKGGALKMARYPGYSDRIRIETWISSLERYRGGREFRLRDEEGRILGRASTLWVFMDLNKRTLMPIPEPFHRNWPVCSDRPLTIPFRKQDFPSISGGFVRNIDIRRRDIDSNNHVHNTRYLEWLTEAVPPELYESCQIEQMEMLYRREALPGIPVQIRTCREGDGVFRHDILDRNRNLLLAAARTVWREKSGLYSPSSRESRLCGNLAG